MQGKQRSRGERMIKGIGTDIIEIIRLEKAIQRRPRLAGRLFSERELCYCQGKRNPWPSLAARFAAKEAVMKALGTGLGGCRWQEIEVITMPGGKPGLQLYGGALALAGEKGISGWQISLSHSGTMAVAMVVAE